MLKDVGALGAGEHMVHLGSERRLSSGVYWLRLTQGAIQATARVVLAD